MSELVTLAYGGGVNSKAIAVEYVRRGLPIDLILFADTGGERKRTYADLEHFSFWLESKGYPAVIRVQRVNDKGEPITLEGECLKRGQLPSIAYGLKACSQKHKGQPQDKFMNHWQRAQEAWKRGEKVVKLIGYDAGEPHRIKDYGDEKYELRYPLVEWGWGRDECVKAIQDAGLPLPGKSACFFCPSTKPHEIRQLMIEEPELLKRALAMEANAKANLTSVKGLGRDWSWESYVEFLEKQMEFPFEGAMDPPCGCYDG